MKINSNRLNMKLKIIEIWNDLKPNKTPLKIHSVASAQLTDFDFLEKPEKQINEKGEVLKQSYIYKGEEVLFIRYNKTIETIDVDGVEYTDEFTGYYDEIVT